MRPDGTLQAARGQARIPSLATALWFLRQDQDRGWETANIVGEDGPGLETTGLSEGMQRICQSIYDHFLEKYGLRRWPVRISLVPREPIPNTPRQYFMKIVCGTEGQATSTESLTNSPGTDLRRILERELESHYEYKKMGIEMKEGPLAGRLEFAILKIIMEGNATDGSRQDSWGGWENCVRQIRAGPVLPSFRTPPSGFGISTRFTGCGL